MPGHALESFCKIFVCHPSLFFLQHTTCTPARRNDVGVLRVEFSCPASASLDPSFWFYSLPSRYSGTNFPYQSAGLDRGSQPGVDAGGP